jgi:hypothetical protein
VAAAAGGGRLVLVSGEPGIGKTRLTAAIAEMAGEYEVPVASGYAIDDPGMPPLWPWRRVGRTVPALTRALGSAAGAGASEPAGGVDSAAARFGMFTDASRALADAAADRGLLVILEDLQWADRTSLLLLRHLAGELARTRLLVVGTFRDTADSPLDGVLPACCAPRARGRSGSPGCPGRTSRRSPQGEPSAASCSPGSGSACGTARARGRSQANARASTSPVTIGVHHAHGFRHWTCEKNVSRTATDPAASSRAQFRQAATKATASGGHR